jgi:SAM-dependent methyltransferase
VANQTNCDSSRELPDWYGAVAQDVLRLCRPQGGVWVDLGSGSGGVGLELVARSESIIILVDPDIESVARGIAQAETDGLCSRVVVAGGRAEAIPLADDSAALVVSRGSIFFWDDPPRGLREVRRILRPGGTAIIGGGLGSAYPPWARNEFIRRKREWLDNQGPGAYELWLDARKPETLARHARQTGIADFRVVPDTICGWLIFQKANAHGERDQS